MKKYYKSNASDIVVEAVSDTRGLVIRSNDSDYVEGRVYEFFPFNEIELAWMWKEISIQDIPFAVSLKDVSNLIQSQKFLDWFNSSESIHPNSVFTFLKENLDVK